MPLHGAFSPRSGLDIEPPKPIDPDPYRAFESALRAARAATHERKVDPPIAKALAAIADALDKAKVLFRAQQREIAARAVGPHPLAEVGRGEAAG